MKRISEVNRVEEKESRKENVMKMKVEMKKSEDIIMKNNYIDDVVNCFLNEKKRKIVIMRIELINRIVYKKDEENKYNELKLRRENIIKKYDDVDDISIKWKMLNENSDYMKISDEMMNISRSKFDEKRKLCRKIDKLMMNRGFDKRLVSMFVMYEKDNELMNVLNDDEIDDIINNKF